MARNNVWGHSVYDDSCAPRTDSHEYVLTFDVYIFMKRYTDGTTCEYIYYIWGVFNVLFEIQKTDALSIHIV